MDNTAQEKEGTMETLDLSDLYNQLMSVKRALDDRLPSSKKPLVFEMQHDPAVVEKAMKLLERKRERSRRYYQAHKTELLAKAKTRYREKKASLSPRE